MVISIEAKRKAVERIEGFDNEKRLSLKEALSKETLDLMEEIKDNEFIIMMIGKHKGRVSEVDWEYESQPEWLEYVAKKKIQKQTAEKKELENQLEFCQYQIEELTKAISENVAIPVKAEVVQ